MVIMRNERMQPIKHLLAQNKQLVILAVPFVHTNVAVFWKKQVRNFGMSLEEYKASVSKSQTENCLENKVGNINILSGFPLILKYYISVSKETSLPLFSNEARQRTGKTAAHLIRNQDSGWKWAD